MNVTGFSGFPYENTKSQILQLDVKQKMMQETELENGFDCDLLKIPGYNLELGKNSVKVRIGTYINDSIKYKRREELEGLDSHITVVDIWNGKKCNKRLISI